MEGAWAENEYTAKGRAIHDSVDRPRQERRKNMVSTYSVGVKSTALGLIGVCDKVEYLFEEDSLISVSPVEYKVGRPKKGNWDKIQLCAQAVSLEEMTGVRIDTAYLYYHGTRRRTAVNISKGLRDDTMENARRMHEIFSSNSIPAANYGLKCKHCSLIEICEPRIGSRAISVKRYVDGWVDK